METFIMPTISVICLVLAFGFRQATHNDRLHDFIPLGCAVLGVVLAAAFMGVSPETIATGAVSGFAATGLWEQAMHLLPQEIFLANGEEI